MGGGILLILKTWAAAWQNQQNDKAHSEDSDQPGHAPRLIRVFAVRMKKTGIPSYPLSAQRRLWSDWVDAQADLSIGWANIHFVGFVMSWLINTSKLKQVSEITWARFTMCLSFMVSPIICSTQKRTTGPLSLTWVHRICWIRTGLEIYDYMLYKLSLSFFNLTTRSFWSLCGCAQCYVRMFSEKHNNKKKQKNLATTYIWVGHLKLFTNSKSEAY